MSDIPLLDELALIAALGVVVTVILGKLRVPTVAGLLVAGGVIGPSGFGLVHSLHAIEVLSEIGVVLLLFTIGLEFSLERLKTIFRQVAVGGFLQVALTVAATALIAGRLGFAPGKSVFFGFVIALSSTAIVLRALAERNELDAPHGRLIVGTLILQDLCVVPMVLVVPLLGQGGGPASAATEVGVALGKAAVLVLATIAVARGVVPRLLGWVDASRSREVFLLAVLALCIGTAWLTSRAGLSLALGAFLGGMVVADTEYGHRAMSDMLPLRDAFVSVFFVSLGMLFDVHTVIERPVVVGLLLAGLLVGKAFVATVASLFMRFPPRVAVLTGVGLAQFGEFGFVLARLGASSGVATSEELRPLLSAGIASMFLTPLLVRLAPHLAAGERLLGPLERLVGARSLADAAPSHDRRSGHVILIGYGVAGRLAARALASRGVEYVVLELNAETVRAARARGEPVFYADATSPEALGHAHIESAAAVAILFNDARAAERVADVATRTAPGVPVMLRTRYLSDRPAVLAAGARRVVVEEVEAGVAAFSELLTWLGVPPEAIATQIADARAYVDRPAERPGAREETGTQSEVETAR